MISKLFHQFLVAISLVTACGVFVHDGRVDGAALVALNFAPRAAAAADANAAGKIRDFLSADAHAHPDHNTAKNLLNSFTYRSPSVPPRDEDKHKAASHHIELAGRHAFDNDNLPIIS